MSDLADEALAVLLWPCCETTDAGLRTGLDEAAAKKEAVRDPGAAARLPFDPERG